MVTKLRFFAWVFAGLCCIAGSGVVGAAPSGDIASDRFVELRRCLSVNDNACLRDLGRDMATNIPGNRDRSLMLARFALLDWAAGDRLAGDTRFLRAWGVAEQVNGPGCFDNIETMFDLEALASDFGHRTAARFILRGIWAEANKAAPNPRAICDRPAEETSWIERLARRQAVLGDETGLRATLDLALQWGSTKPEERPAIAPPAVKLASLLSRFDRPKDAVKICDRNKDSVFGDLGEDVSATDQANAHWSALACYRHANLAEQAQLGYQEFAAIKAQSIGLQEDETSSVAGVEEALERSFWEMLQTLSWDDPILFPYAPEFDAKTLRACFERPTARCIAVHAMEYSDRRKRSSRRRSASNWPAGSLDGFANFLVGSGNDPVGVDARTWFVGQASQAPIEDLSTLMNRAADKGDLVWARTIFYAWYGNGGEAFFNDLTTPKTSTRRSRDVAKRQAELHAWSLHVAWKIATVVADMEPAFEPEELAEFGRQAWINGIERLPPLKAVPRIELIDADERSGTHLLNLCARSALGIWAYNLFTKAHMPDEAGDAAAILPEAARDCAFARRSVGPLINGANWFATQGDRRSAEALLAEAADRLTRPHYHVYEDSDPALGAAAVAAAALSLEAGITVPTPYTDEF